MQCPECGQESREAARFCRECGTRFALTCAACGSPAEPGSKYCEECGEPLTSAPAPASRAPSAPSVGPTLAPEAYTPRHLAERILTSRAALEGERKQVTVLFADLKGSMELLADRDPEEARALLDPVLERMMEAVHRYEGTVNQVMGDGIMALFGAPLAHEDHALRACYAALRMQEAVRQYADQMRWKVGLPIQIRVGLNSGEVVVRSIGSDLHMDYTAVGQTTHLAARMEQVATPGSILLAPDTLRLVEGYVQVRTLGRMEIKGLSQPVGVYELVGAGMARSRLQATAARGLTKFVGRDPELETLRRTLEQASRGHGQIVALVGEPGVGKSRLVWEFNHSHRAQGWLVLESGSVSYGKATSYLPVIDLLKTYGRIEARDDARSIREKVTGKLLTLDRALEPLLPAVLALLDVPVEDPAWEALDPPQRRQRTLEACKRLLLRESQEQPLLLVFEDLHWIDAETQALLDTIVDSLPSARILLLVNYRPEYEHTWHQKTYYQQLRLDPLPTASAAELLAALVGHDNSLDRLKRLLVERTEGNPFFLEESVRSLVENGVLAEEQGGYRLEKPVESTQVPATVQAVLAARIDRLAPEDKHLLQSAAVIGKDAPFPLLQAIAGLAEDALCQGLARLQAAEFLYETSLFPDLEYTFKHALTHEVAYGSLLQERRRTLHARIVEALETLRPDRLPDHVERLAHHAFRAEVWPRAASYLRQAGARAASRSAHQAAISYYDQALVAIERLPRSRETDEQAIDIRFDLRQSLVPLLEYEQLRDHVRTAEALAAALNDPHRLGRASCYMTNYLWMAADHEAALASGQRALALAIAEDDSVLRLETRFHLAQVHHSLGDYSRAIDLLRQSLVSQDDSRFHEHSGRRWRGVSASAWLTMCLAEGGEFAEGMARGEEALQVAEAVDDAFLLIMALTGIGYLDLLKGDLDDAIRVLQRALELCEVRLIPLLIPRVGSILGYAYALSGQVAAALTLLEQVVQRASVSGFKAFQSLRIAWLGEACLLAGRLDDALGHASSALSLAREYRERGHEAWALRLLGEIAARAEPPDVEQAERSYHQALALAEELGMRPLVAHCHLGLGTVYQRSGRPEQAQSELAAALELYRAMEMPYWLGRAETALAAGSG